MKEKNETKRNKTNEAGEIRQRRPQKKKRPDRVKVSRHLWLIKTKLWRANQHEPACFAATILDLVFLVAFGHTTTIYIVTFDTACRSLALAFSAAIHFAMKRSAPCFAVLRHSPSS